MSIKQTPNLRQWLQIGSIAFGVSCTGTLPFTQHLGLSVLIGLATMPGVVTGVVIRSRHPQIQRQLERGKLRLIELQHRSLTLSEQLQIKHKDRQEIELRVSQLHDLAANLTDRIDRERERHQQLAQKLATLDIYCQAQASLATNLDRKIQEKQACLLEVDTDLSSLKLELTQVSSEKIQAKDANVDITSMLEQQTIALADIQLQINNYSVTKQELELQVQQLQDRKLSETRDIEESIAQKHSLLHQLDLAISDRHKSQSETIAEIDRLNQIITQKTPELTIQTQRLAETQAQLISIKLELATKQAELTELVIEQTRHDPAAQIYTNENELDPFSDRLLQRELKIAQLELSSRQAELDNLEFKLHNKLQSINELDLDNTVQSLDPQPPIIARDIDIITTTIEWYDKFIGNPHLTVLKHIEKHGTITESEASSKLGNARSVRQFANKLGEYAQELPFSIRVESSPKGNRYLKEDRN